MSLDKNTIAKFKSLLTTLSNRKTANLKAVVKAFVMIKHLPNGVELLNQHGFMTKKQILAESDSMNTAIIPPTVKKIKSNWFYDHTSVPVTPFDTQKVVMNIMEDLVY